MTPARLLTRLALAGITALHGLALAQAGAPLQGQVLEVREAPGYTYLRLKTAGGETWAAVTTAAVKPGALVSIVNTAVMENFESRTLQRRFDRIVFGQLAGPAAGSTRVPTARGGALPDTTLPSAMHSPAAAAPPAKAGAAAPVLAAVPRALGAQARTVAEITQGKATLKDKSVLVRARVVKVSNGIMGKNWLHLQDGSGQASDGSNDLLATSQASLSVGDVVQLRGTVRTDVVLGSGYAYAVLLEDAQLQK